MPETRDITLWELILRFFKWCGRGLKAFFIWIGELIKLSFRKWYIVFTLAIFGFFVGYYFSRPANRIYQAHGVVRVNGATPFDVKQALAPLTLVMPQHIEPSMAFAERLGLPFENVSGLRWIRLLNVVDMLNDSIAEYVDFSGTFPLNDTLSRISPFYLCVSLEMKNLSQLPNIENAIVNYANSNPQIQAKFNAKKSELQNELEMCDRQLVYLDSLTRVFYFNFPQGAQFDLKPYSNSVIAGRRSIELLHEDIIELQKHHQTIQSELSTFNQPVEFISHISVAPKALNNRILCVILGVLGGWILGLIFSALIENRASLRSWLNEKK